MGGFSDNYECGYWDDDTPVHKLKKVDKKKIYKETISSKYCYLNVLLEGNEHHLPRDLDIEVLLELKHNENEADRKSLDVYDGDIFLGSVQKVFELEGIDNSKIVNEFCFLQDKFKEIDALWDGIKLYLRCKK